MTTGEKILMLVWLTTGVLAYFRIAERIDNLRADVKRLEEREVSDD